LTSLNVTLHRLSLGVQHDETGLYLKSYSDATIKMIIQPRGVMQLKTSVGDFARVDSVGVTDIEVKDGDTVTDSAGVTYTVLTSQPVMLGDKIVYYEVGLSGYAPEDSSTYVPPCVVFFLASNGGSTDPSEGMHVYSYGDDVTVTATSGSGSVFVQFEQDNGVTSTDNPYTFSVSRNMAVLADFAYQRLPPERSGIMSVGFGFANPEISESVELRDEDAQNSISESLVMYQPGDVTFPYLFPFLHQNGTIKQITDSLSETVEVEVT